MKRIWHYYRARGDGSAEQCGFDEPELHKRHIARAMDGSITEREALVIVNDWNRLATQMELPWRYWVVT